MRKQKTLNQKKIWIKGMLGVFTVLMTFGFSSFLSFAAEGKVTADTAKIRAETNTSSEVVGSTSKGKTIDIIEAVKDASGAVWYKVPIGNNEYGYIRSDLVETSETIEATGGSSGSSGSSENSSSGSDSNETTEKPAATVPTAIGEQQATVSQASVRIRAGASTQHDTVASLPQGTSITLIGEANDSAGNKWYQLTCNYNNKTVEGYIRSDLITIGGSSSSGSNSGSSENTDNEDANTADGEGEVPEGEGEADPEGEPEGEEQEPEQEQEPEHNDYEVRYTQNEEGEYEYYLYDNINGTMQKLGNLLGVVDSANANIAKMQEQANNAKIIIIILAVVVVLLVVAVTVLIFKIRDLSYDDYDYDEEEEEEEEPVVRRKVKRTVEEEEPAPVRKKRPVSQEAAGGRERTAKQPSSRPASERPSNSTRPSGGARPKNPEAELHAAERKAPVKKQESRKAQNFLVDDDEFEFEFLNMDDKDL